VHGGPWTDTGFPGSVLHMTTQEMAPPSAAAPTMTYSEIMRREVKAACARRDMTGRDLAGLLGVSQQTVSDRWRGRTPWTLDDVERLETVLGLSRGALLIACARRDSNPQPSDLSPLQVLLAVLLAIAGAAAGECWCSREGCPENYLVPCDCPCHGGDDDLVALPVFRTPASADVEVWELDDEDEYHRGGCVICSGDCEPGRCIMFEDLADAWELAA
jgi:transcriptional regulator with XRE-family HTH domain